MRLVRSGGLFSVLLVTGGNMFGTVISAIALILFSRVMGPAEFGIFSAAFATMQIGVRLSDLGLNTAAERAIARIQANSPSQVDRYLRLVLWLKLALIVLVILLGWFTAPYLAMTVLHMPSPDLLRLALITTIGTVFFEYTNIIFQGTQRFAMVARITVAQAVGKLAFGLILIWQGALNAISATILYGLMPLVGALSAWKPSPLKHWSLPKAPQVELRGLLKVARWTAIAAISATFADNLDILMVQSFMSSYDTGLWAAAARIAAFASIIGWSSGVVLSNRVAGYGSHKHLHAYLSKSWKIALGAFFGLLLTIPLSGLAIYLTVGPEYLAATASLQILIIAAGLAAATTPFAALFYLFDRPQYYAYAGILSTGILLLGDYFTIPVWGLTGAAMTRIVVRVAVLIFTLIYTRKAYVEFIHQR